MTEISSTLIDLAQAKMLDEMSKPHSMAEDHIHNWLCNQTDEELLAGILKPGKSIKSALHALMSVAKKQKVQVISDEEGFRIVANYFKSEETDVEQPDGVGTEDNGPKYKPPVMTPERKAEMLTNQKKNDEWYAKQAKEKAEKKAAEEKKKSGNNMSIFDFLDDPLVETEETGEEAGENDNEGDDPDEIDD